MATVTFNSLGGGQGINLGLIQAGGLFDYDFSTFTTAGAIDTIKVFDSATTYAQFTGTGFVGTYVGTQPNGDLVSVTQGIVNSLVVKESGITEISITGMTASASVLFNAAATNNTTLFINTLLAGNDTINCTAFADNVRGANGNDTLRGFGGGDTLRGEAGNDRLVGGAGRDLLLGGVNNDIFDFDAITDSGTALTTRDIIFDFVKGQDKIDLSTIDANLAVTAIGNSAFGLLARDLSVAHNGAVGVGKIGWYWEGAATATLADNKTILKINNDAIDGIDMTIEIRGLINLSATPGVDFIF